MKSACGELRNPVPLFKQVASRSALAQRQNCGLARRHHPPDSVRCRGEVPAVDTARCLYCSRYRDSLLTQVLPSQCP
jgi:hypothetical protein